MKLAIIDIGTVTARFAVFEATSAQTPTGVSVRLLDKRSQICNLGQDVDRTRRIADAARQRVVVCVQDYVTQAQSWGAEMIACMLTSAARDATNCKELLDALLGLHLAPEIIPGSIEARLAFMGAVQGIDAEALLVADNGGGSTDLARGERRNNKLEIIKAKSFNAGCRRFTDRFFSSAHAMDAQSDGRVSERALREAHSYCARLFAEAQSQLYPLASDKKPEFLLVTGGTATSLIAIDKQLEPYDATEVHGQTVSLERLVELEHMLAELPLAERKRVSGLQPSRAEVIVAGCAIIAELIRAWGFEGYTASEHDLLLGSAIVAAAQAVNGETLFAWKPNLTEIVY